MKNLVFCISLVCISLNIKAQNLVNLFQDFSNLNSTQLVDLNGDEKLDVVGFKNTGDRQMAVQFNTSQNGEFSFEQTIFNELVTGTPTFGDFDGDADIDIIVSSNEDLKVLLYLNDGSGGFELEFLDVAPADIFKAADLDGDLDIDIVAYNSSDEILYHYSNEGNLVFNTSQIQVDIEGPFNFDIGDIDQDNDIDIVLGYKGYFLTQIAILENQGNLSFIDNLVYAFSEPGALSTLEIHDIDDDGSMDIIIASSIKNAVYGLINDGSNNFLLNTLAEAEGFIKNFNVGDFNNDQKKDFVITTDQTDITLHLNTGFTPFKYNSEVIATISPVFNLASGDLDNDGDRDLIVTQFNSILFRNEFSAVHTSNTNFKSIKVFPNPTNDVLNIENLDNQFIYIELIDASFRTVFKKQGALDQLDFSNVEDGMYFLSIKDAHKKALSSIIKIIKY